MKLDFEEVKQLLEEKQTLLKKSIVKGFGSYGRKQKRRLKDEKVNWTYVDMDGVIADFFKALALEFGVNHWKDIPTQEDVIERLTGTDFFSRISIFPNNN